MRLIENKLYQDDICYVASLPLPWEKLREKSLLISGAAGMIGSFLVDVIMYKNRTDYLRCSIVALGRNVEKAKNRFWHCWEEETFRFIQCDVSQPLDHTKIGHVDYVLHMASNTHPLQYSLEPISTITTNLFGLQNLLEYAEKTQQSEPHLYRQWKCMGKIEGRRMRFAKMTSAISTAML